MTQFVTALGESADMEKKELLAAAILYFIGGVLFLHRVYLRDYRPTALTGCIAMGLLGLSVFLQGTMMMALLTSIVGLGWLAFVLIDGWRLRELVDRANSQMLDELK